MSGQVTGASLRRSDSLVALYPFFCILFGLLDQFATWLGMNEFNCLRTPNFFERFFFWEVCFLLDSGTGFVMFVYIYSCTFLGIVPAEG